MLVADLSSVFIDIFKPLTLLVMPLKLKLKLTLKNSSKTFFLKSISMALRLSMVILSRSFQLSMKSAIRFLPSEKTSLVALNALTMAVFTDATVF